MEIRLLSSLEKVFLDEAPQEIPLRLTAMQGETTAFQLAFRDTETAWQEVTLQVESAAQVHIRQVAHVPVRMANYPDGDRDTLRGGVPGLYPDLLVEVRPHALKLSPCWTTLWVDVSAEESGIHPVTLRLTGESGLLAERTIPVEVLPAALPPQKLLLTRWFHCDGLAQYYGVDVFSEEHWALIERFLRSAAGHGVNMVLTPIHTPPLDTAVGHERLTTQLVDVAVEDGEYRFGMDKLRRWIRLAKDCGITHFEMAHLYTQWGAHHAPKIMAAVNGEVRRIFGWDTPAVCDEYRAFLAAYIPAVRRVLAEEGVAENTRWHISDEPSGRNMAAYLAARRQTDDLLDGCIVMDALSKFDFYQQGVVAHPVVATDHVQPFIDANMPDLWVYYCCAQYKKTANMFIAMPSCRSRILGFQLFRYRAAGFLHWAWNFYNCMYSYYPVDPYQTTDADCGVPAGDPFQVYPGEGGEPVESLRLMVFDHALNDLRACELLAEKKGRVYAEALLDEAFGGKLTFETQADAMALLALRERINREIMALEKVSTHDGYQL
nr:DUF4091 domain-containing protein [Clostridia bacterium]